MEMEKKSDMKTLAKVDTENYYINIPRFFPKEMVNYSAIEAFKDGMWSSGKYQGKSCNLQSKGILITVVITMNYMPDLTALSSDRYEIWRLDEMENDLNGDLYDCIVDNDMKNIYNMTL